MAPPNQSQCDSFYGNPRHAGDPGRSNPNWEVENLVYFVPPWQMYYAGYPMKKGFRLHKKCVASLTLVFNALWQQSGKSQKTIDSWGLSIFGGSYNYRLMRGVNQLSMHSYGCAIDIDPVNNGLNDHTPKLAQFPKVIAIFKEYGWVWGGDWKRPDGMHFQYAQP